MSSFPFPVAFVVVHLFVQQILAEPAAEQVSSSWSSNLLSAERVSAVECAGRFLIGSHYPRGKGSQMAIWRVNNENSRMESLPPSSASASPFLIQPSRPFCIYLHSVQSHLSLPLQDSIGYFLHIIIVIADTVSTVCHY